MLSSTPSRNTILGPICIFKNWTRIEDDEDHNNAAELALTRSPNLRSIQARLDEAPPASVDLRQVALKRIIALAPNLEEVDIFEVPSGDSGGLHSRRSLEERIMRNRFLEGIVPSLNSIRTLRSRGANHKTLFADVTDMSKLETLDMGYVLENYLIMEPSLRDANFPRLKHLSLALNSGENEAFYHEITMFLAGCESLESISITDGASHISLTAILSHRRTLRTLVLHETEKADWEKPRKPTSVQDIQALAEHCCMLEDITIDGDLFPTVEGFNKGLVCSRDVSVSAYDPNLPAHGRRRRSR